MALVVRQSAVPIVAGVGLGAAAVAAMTGVLSSYLAARAGLVVNPAAVLREE